MLRLSAFAIPKLCLRLPPNIGPRNFSKNLCMIIRSHRYGWLIKGSIVIITRARARVGQMLVRTKRYISHIAKGLDGKGLFAAASRGLAFFIGSFSLFVAAGLAFIQVACVRNSGKEVGKSGRTRTAVVILTVTVVCSPFHWLRCIASAKPITGELPMR